MKILNRRIVIKRREQFSYALLATALVLITNLIMWLGLNFVFDVQTAHRTTAHAWRELQLMLGVLVLINGGMVFAMFLYFLNHVLGPVYKIEKALIDLMEKGHATHLVPRKHDFLKDTTELINEFIKTQPKK